VVGGALGAIASKIMGPRIGRFDPETNEPFDIPGHSSPLATLGVFILWTGWLGFNPGSVINITGGNGSTASRAAVMTILSSASSALSALFLSHRLDSAREFDINIALNGALAGLVSVTASCAFIEMWAALAIGVMGGCVFLWARWFTLYKLRIDDPLDATAVHLFCGIYGVIAGAFFANPQLILPYFRPPSSGVAEVPAGVFYGGNTFATLYPNGTIVPGGSTKGALVANAVVELTCILTWVTVCMAPLLYFFNRMEILRVAPDIELVGLDISHHGGQAYEADPLVTWNYHEAKRTTHKNPSNNGAPSLNTEDETARTSNVETMKRAESGAADATSSSLPKEADMRPPPGSASKASQQEQSPLIKVVLESGRGTSGRSIPLVLVRDEGNEAPKQSVASPAEDTADQKQRTGDSVSLA
jgi:Amt family ammonium transporter